jgi:hypothetical protein
MKLKLDVDELNEDFFEETRLLGITATIKNSTKKLTSPTRPKIL